MTEKRFKTLQGSDIDKMIYKEVCHVLETAREPVLYKRGYMRLDIRTRDGRNIHSGNSLPDNWRDLTFALSLYEAATGLKGWDEVIQRDDGEIFLVRLEYTTRGEVEVVL